MEKSFINAVVVGRAGSCKLSLIIVMREALDSIGIKNYYIDEQLDGHRDLATALEAIRFSIQSRRTHTPDWTLKVTVTASADRVEQQRIDNGEIFIQLRSPLSVSILAQFYAEYLQPALSGVEGAEVSAANDLAVHLENLATYPLKTDCPISFFKRYNHTQLIAKAKRSVHAAY